MPDHDRLSILHIEDNNADQQIVRKHLGKELQTSFDIQACSTLREALCELTARRYDAILVDPGLTDSKGLPTVEAVLSASQRSPVLILSGKDDQALAERAIHSGAQEYLLKDHLTAESLERTIRHAVERQRTREALQLSEHRFRELAEMLPEVVFECDLEGNLSFISNVAFHRYGYTKEQFDNGLNAFDLLAPEDRLRAQQDMARLLAGEQLGSIPYMAVQGNGVAFPAIIRATVVLSDEKPVGIRGVLIDFTEQEKAREALETANHIIRFSPIGMFIYHFEEPDRLILVDANPEAERLTGVKLADWKGREFNAIWPMAKQQGIPDAFLTAFHESPFNTDELTYQHSHTEGRYRIRAFRIPGDRLVVSFEDVGDLKNAEAALQERELQYRSLFEHSSIGIYQTTPDGRILAANPALVRMLGYSSFEDLSKRNLENGHYEPQSSREEFKERIERKGAFEGRETAWRRSDGSLLHVRESARVVRDNQGNVLYYEGMLEDVTERWESHEALRESEERFRNIVELSPVGILSVDHKGQIRSCNRAFLAMTEYSEDEFVGTHFTNLPAVHASDMPKYIRAFRSINIGRTPAPFETSWVTKSGDLRHGEIHVSVVKPESGPWTVLAIVQDITARKTSEEQLRQSLALQQGILKASPIGIGLIRGETFQWVSNGVCEMSGFSVEELIGQSPRLTAPDEEEYRRIQQAMESDLLKYGVANTETQWMCKDGTRIDVDLRFSHLDGDKPELGGIFTILDISKRKQMERSLTLTQFSIDTTDVMIMWIRPSGRLDMVNEASCRLLGYSRDELLNLNVWDLTPDYPRDRRKLLWETLRTSGNEIGETEFIRKDRSIFPVELKAQYIQFQKSEYEFVYATDITVRKAAERALKESEENYRTIFNSASDAIMLHDAKTGRILDGNAKTEEMFGYSLSEFLDLQVADFSASDPAFSREESLRRIHAAAGGKPQLFEWQARRKNGELFWVEVSLRQTTLLGADIVLAVVRDISDRKNLEARLRQSQKLESIGTLASGVAHEINNPLTGMINYAELISSRVDDPTLREYAEGIKEEGDRVARIVRNLLSFARQDAEHASPAHMTDIINASLSIIGSLLRKDFIQFDLDVPSDLPPIRCRSQQIQQVLINLITNARDSLNEKYPISNPDKRIRIQVKEYCSEGQRWLQTVVEDRGLGIPDHLLVRVFDPFFTTKTRDQGTGLGLSISYGIILEHNGRILIESQEGEFTRFLIDLPVEMPKELQD